MLNTYSPFPSIYDQTAPDGMPLWSPVGGGALTLDVDVEADAGVALAVDGLQVIEAGILPRHPRHVQHGPAGQHPGAIYGRHAVPVVRDGSGVAAGCDDNLTRGALPDVLRVDLLRKRGRICKHRNAALIH